MRDALSHRGPDDAGITVVGSAGLVHTRLSIIDVSRRAHQPMRHPDGRLWLSYNGEIYNHMLLRDLLRDVEFLSAGDTETLMHTLRTRGADALPLLNGQFAFAALDLDRNQLLLARDRFGIKPLYIARHQGGLWFASEPAALLAVGVDRSPGSIGWQSVVDWSCYRSGATLLAGVRRVEPGTYIEVDLDTCSATARRWDTCARHVSAERQTELQGYARSQLVGELTKTLRSAVHDALLSDVRVGTLCSGGVDSSVVTALASEVRRDLIAFGARYRGDRALDEGPSVFRVGESLGVEVDLLDVTKSHWRSGFVDATLHFGAPIATASAVTISQMAERARNRGIKVLLTGEGADELFAGYSNPFDGPLHDFLSSRQRLRRRLEPILFGHPLRVAHGLARRTRRLLGGAPVEGAADSVRTLPPAGHPPDLAAEIANAYAHHAGVRRRIETKLLEDFHFTLSHLLNRMDENMMQVSVEARVPFLDPRVVDLALNLPLEARVAPWSKGILRDVARSLLPLYIAQRAKVYGMDFDAGRWIEEAADPRFLTHGVFQEAFGIPKADLTGLLAVARGSLRVRLWSAEVWCRSVFGGDTPTMIEKELWAGGP